MSERTRRDIVEACNKLLTKKDIESISTADIMSEARVSRSTFYRYFHDKYDVMNYNYKQIVDSAVEGSSSFRDLLLHIGNAFANDDWKKRHKIHDYIGTNSFSDYIYRYSMDIAEEVVRTNRNGEGFTKREWFQMSIICYGIARMSKECLREDFSQTPEEVMEIMYSMFPETIKEYYI